MRFVVVSALSALTLLVGTLGACATEELSDSDGGLAAGDGGPQTDAAPDGLVDATEDRGDAECVRADGCACGEARLYGEGCSASGHCQPLPGPVDAACVRLWRCDCQGQSVLTCGSPAFAPYDHDGACLLTTDDALSADCVGCPEHWSRNEGAVLADLRPPARGCTPETTGKLCGYSGEACVAAAEAADFLRCERAGDEVAAWQPRAPSELDAGAAP